MQLERPKKPSFIIVTKDFSGLGYAKMIQDAGYPVVMAYQPGDDEKADKEKFESYKNVGKRIVERVPLNVIFEAREQYRESYWIFDQNHHWEICETLVEEGFRTWGGRELMYNMEHDRDFGVEIAKKAGLGIPESHEFNSLEEGTKFLEENPDRAFVFKVDDQSGAWDTYVPDSKKADAANRELQTYLKSLSGNNGKDFILQERKDGVEVNFEVWCYEGKPFLAFCDLESKKKLNDDYGCLVGGAQDIGFLVPIESRGIQQTVAKFLALDEYKNYTGFLDINVIVADRGNYFLEFCARFGYPAHCTLFSALAIDSFPELIMDMIDGRVENFEERFKHGFAAGITLYTDKQRLGLPVYVTPEAEKKFYIYDLFKKDGITMTSGFSAEIGIITAHGYTIKEAAEEAIKERDSINFPNRSSRSDLDKNNYGSAPQGRYDALHAMKYV